MLHNEFKTTCTWIKKKMNDIQRTATQRHSRKLKIIEKNDLRPDVSQKIKYQ